MYDPGSEWRRHVLQVGLQALVQAGCKPRAIVVRRDWSPGFNGTPNWAFNDLKTLMTDAQMCALVQNLRVFLLVGRPLFSEHNEKDIRQDGTLGRFLENAYQLEDIRLEAPGNGGQDSLRALVGAHYKGLRRVTFSHAQFCDRDLEDWLLLHSASLEYIKLKYVHARECQWDQFLDALKTKPWAHLSYVNLMWVSYRNSDDEIEDWHWTYGSAPLVDYITGKSDSNPYHIYHPGWFPKLFGST